ncbi:MAG: hypothetical protein ACI4LX_06135 [Treponema sp.]
MMFKKKFIFFWGGRAAFILSLALLGSFFYKSEQGNIDVPLAEHGMSLINFNVLLT